MARLKVVAHFRSGEIVKGYSDLPLPVDASGSPAPAPVSLPKTVKIEPQQGGYAGPVPIDDLKALYFVKSFDGDRHYSEIRFFNPEPNIEGLWVHLCFLDGETCEGIVHNSLSFITESGFLMKPPDPMSNNNAAYVSKSALTQFRVVGVKATY